MEYGPPPGVASVSVWASVWAAAGLSAGFPSAARADLYLVLTGRRRIPATASKLCMPTRRTAIPGSPCPRRPRLFRQWRAPSPEPSTTYRPATGSALGSARPLQQDTTGVDPTPFHRPGRPAWRLHHRILVSKCAPPQGATFTSAYPGTRWRNASFSKVLRIYQRPTPAALSPSGPSRVGVVVAAAVAVTTAGCLLLWCTGGERAADDPAEPIPLQCCRALAPDARR